MQFAIIMAHVFAGLVFVIAVASVIDGAITWVREAFDGRARADDREDDGG